MRPDAHGLRSFGEKNSIGTFAYGAVSEPGPLEELMGYYKMDYSPGDATPDVTSPVMKRISKAHTRSSAQVALRWALQSGVAVSVRPSKDFELGRSYCTEFSVTLEHPIRLEQCDLGVSKRAQLFEWWLTNEEMTGLDALKSPDGNPTLFSAAGCPGSFAESEESSLK